MRTKSISRLTVRLKRTTTISFSCESTLATKILALAAGILVLTAASRHAWAGTLRAGVAVEDITVERPTTMVHDPLRIKALVLEEGDTRAVIVCLDLVIASDALVSGIRQCLQDKLGIAGANVLVSASHNHHAQGQVVSDVAERTLKAVRRALNTIVPVKTGVGAGREDRITMNRRLRLADGEQWTIRRANPSPQDSEVENLEPIDPEIGILRLDRTNGQPLAVLYNFAGHAYGGAPDGGVTADFPGFASAVLEQALGHGTVALFLQGAAGDVTPIRYKDVDSPPPTERLGTMLGLSALKALAGISTREDGPLHIISETIELPRREDLEERIRILEERQEEILQFFTGIGCGSHGAGTFLSFKNFLPLYIKHAVDPVHPAYSSYLYHHETATGQHDLEHLDAENRKRLDKYLESIHQMERLIRLRSNLHLLKQQRERGSQGSIVAEIQGIRIGEFVLITFPGEPFAEVGLRIKQQSPFRYTFLAAYANGFVGYAPTAASYESQCYENSLTALAPEWQRIYEAKALDILRRLDLPRPATQAADNSLGEEGNGNNSPGEQPGVRLAIVIAEDEYESRTTLPEFARNYLGKDFRVNFVFANPEDRNDLPGIEILNDSDIALLAVRRRVLPREQMHVIRKFVADGKPLVAIRTSSHAFCLRDKSPQEGCVEWPEFDREVLGGYYHDHHGGGGTIAPTTYVWVVEGAEEHPIMTGIPTEEFIVQPSLYKHLPLAETATCLMMGRAGARKPHEPVAWTNTTRQGAKVFYTMLGHPADFKLPVFRRLLLNGLYWAAGTSVPEPPAAIDTAEDKIVIVVPRKIDDLLANPHRSIQTTARSKSTELNLKGIPSTGIYR